MSYQQYSDEESVPNSPKKTFPDKTEPPPEDKGEVLFSVESKRKF